MSYESVIPPSSQWTQLHIADKGGFLSFYYSDSNSVIPVRDITRLGDSKSDPNLETKTYGMFSTCEEDMRRRGVRLDIRFRRYLYLDPETVERLLSLIKAAPDKTEEYIKEIRRLELTNLQKHGFTYPNWKKKEGFDWEWARKYLEGKRFPNGSAFLAVGQ